MQWLKGVGMALAVAGATWGLGSAPASAHDYGKWGGFYFGAHAGYSWADADWDFDNPDISPSTRSFSTDDAIVGGHIGLQHQFGNWVIGAEASFAKGPGSQTINGVDLFNGGGNVGTLHMDIDSIFTATARIGYAWDRWLGYVKGGYAGAQVKLATDDNFPPDFGFSTRDWHNGWTVGAGLEYMLLKGVIIGVEYNYIDLSESRTTDVVTLSTGTFQGTGLNDVDTSIHSVMGRLSFKLGRDEDKHEPMK